MEKHSHTPEETRQEKKNKINEFADKTPNEAKEALEKNGKAIVKLFTDPDGFNIEHQLVDWENAINLFLQEPTAEASRTIRKLYDRGLSLVRNVQTNEALTLSSSARAKIDKKIYDWFGKIRPKITEYYKANRTIIDDILKHEHQTIQKLKTANPAHTHKTVLTWFDVKAGDPEMDVIDTKVKHKIRTTPILDKHKTQNLDQHMVKHSAEMEKMEAID